MRLEHTAARVFGATFLASLLIAVACGNPVPIVTAYRCQPSSPHPDERCPDGEQCCSDDPAALDLLHLDGPELPAYEGRGDGHGIPLFSDDRNDDSSSGMCIRSGSVAPAFALPSGCPVPCNPSWDSDSVAAVCGAGSFCCQTLELDASDCVFDPAIGDDGCWRPARGDDIIGLGGLDATSWSAGALASHQDPGGHECEAFVMGLADEQLDGLGITADEVRIACLRRLGVANQRGFCIGGPGVAGCPLAQPSFRDACEQRNDAEQHSGCG